MTDLSAHIGLASLKSFDKIIRHRKDIFNSYQCYLDELQDYTNSMGEVTVTMQCDHLLNNIKQKEFENG